MQGIAMLRGGEPAEVLTDVVDKGIWGVMSYVSSGKWRAAKVLPVGLTTEKFSVELLPQKKAHPMNIQIGQSVGMSLKYGFGKLLFETTISDLQPSSASRTGGMIVLNVPGEVEFVQKRNFFRVQIPRELKVEVALRHRRSGQLECGLGDVEADCNGDCWQGELVDISAGGAQVAISVTTRPNFKMGQYVTTRFTPMPHEEPVAFNAQIKNICPTADGVNLCFGLQIVGLEASPEGRVVLGRLCEIVEQYHQLNQTSAKQQEMEPAGM